MRYNATPGVAGPGVREKDLHPSSGLRLVSINPTVSMNWYGVSAQINFGALGAATDVTSWTSIRAYASIWSEHMPFPMTPFISFFIVPTDTTLPSTVSVKLRVKGMDQFGNAIEEVTPWITKVMDDEDYLFAIYLSKVFSAVYDVEYMSRGIDGDSAVPSRLAVGWACIIDPTRVESTSAKLAYTTVLGFGGYDVVWNALGGSTTGSTPLDLMGTEANWGFGIPLEVAPFGPAIPHAAPEVIGAYATILREKTTPTVVMAGYRLPVIGQSINGGLPVTGVVVGRSAPGWQGCMSKIGFASSDSWATKVLGMEFGGSSQRASDLPATAAQVGEDELLFNFLIRTTVGTARGANPTSTYALG